MQNISLNIFKKIKEMYTEGALNYISGHFLETQNKRTMEVYSPINGEAICSVSISEAVDLENLISKIKTTQKIWSDLTLKKRTEIIYNYRNLLIGNMEQLAQIIHIENGKCLADAKAEILKAIETVEFACSLPNLINSKAQEVSNNIWAFEEYKPVGIVACITPFNFPTMVPHWTIAQAIALGNAVILKPSEQTPLASQYIAKLWKQAGLMDGIFNVFNGEIDAVRALCENKDIRAISFVGSSKVAEIIYNLGTLNKKRVLALGGAKNYILVSKTVKPNEVIKDIISSAYGMTGQRCMAASVIITIGENDLLVQKLTNNLKQMTLGPNIDYEQGLSPVASYQNLENIKNYINYAIDNNAKVLVNGLEFKVDDIEFKNGYYIGPTLIDWTGCESKMKTEEIFGPVLEIIQAKDLEHAIKLQNASPYGNAASIFTHSGQEAFEIRKKLQAGMLGINIGVPVPREPFSFGGIKYSKFGYGDITGYSAINFWSDLIKTTLKWNHSEKQDWLS